MGVADRDYMYERRGPFPSGRSRPGHSSSTASRLFFWLVIFALLFLAFRWLGEWQWERPFPATAETHWFFRVEDVPKAELTITAPARKVHYVVRLDDWISRAPLALIYVRAGETSRTQVPLGRYRVTIDKGTRWLGPERMFGRGSDVREAVNPIHLYRTENQTMGQHIRLDASMNGNMPTRPVGLF